MKRHRLHDKIYGDNIDPLWEIIRKRVGPVNQKRVSHLNGFIVNKSACYRIEESIRRKLNREHIRP